MEGLCPDKLCGALQTHFHGRGRSGKRHLQRRFLRKRGAAGGRLLPLGGAVAQRLRGFKSAEPEKTVKRSSRRTGVNLQFFPVQPTPLGLKGASSPFFVAPARRNRCDLAVLNAQHLLRKPVCDLKAPLGLSCLAGTAALFFSFGVKREHPRQPPLAQRSVFTLRWRLRKQKNKTHKFRRTCASWQG